MTGKEIKAMQDYLPKWENGVPPVRTDMEKRLATEMDCREMVNCLLLYWGPRSIQSETYGYEQYLRKFEAMLGEGTVERICKEQLEDFKRAVVLNGVGRDGEGNSYNSLVWADEMLVDATNLIVKDLIIDGSENGVGYTVPDGKYHIYAYLDEIDEQKVIVLEPNKVIDGAHEPVFGDTYIAALHDYEGLRNGIEWCLNEFAIDRGWVLEKDTGERYLDQAELTRAKELIQEFCANEYGYGEYEESESGYQVPFDDLRQVGIGYTTISDEEIPIQAYANLVDFRIERYLGWDPATLIDCRQYASLEALIENELENLDFYDLIDVSENQIAQVQELENNCVNEVLQDASERCVSGIEREGKTESEREI